MTLPDLLYIQKILVHENFLESYQQFLRKLIAAHKNQNINKNWVVYEKPFGTVSNHREFIFIRSLNSWSDLDIISKEESMSQILSNAFGETEALQWLKIAQTSIMKITTEIYSKMKEISLE